MIVFMTGVLLVKARAHDNHRLLPYHDNGFCNMIIILLHITNRFSLISLLRLWSPGFQFTPVDFHLVLGVVDKGIPSSPGKILQKNLYIVAGAPYKMPQLIPTCPIPLPLGSPAQTLGA